MSARDETGVPTRSQILCISLSRLVSDARVLRQIGLLAQFGDVTTVGFGPAPDGVAHHVEVPTGLTTLPQTWPGVFRLALRAHRSAALSAPAVSWVARRLTGARFDMVVANEARVLALASHLAGAAPVWADMHEWAPEERTHILSWRLLVAPFMTYLCATHLPDAALITTVSEGIAELYESRFGVAVEVMTNAGPYRDLSPSPVAEAPIRLVHSGVAVHGRRLELMIDAMGQLDDRWRLTLYLMPGGDGGAYLRELQARAANDPRIVFREPVPPSALPDVLNEHDIGVFWIPPTHTNARLTLPNKLFDFVQARLAIAVGPSPEMARLVTGLGLGVVSEDFELASCVESLRAFTGETIERSKWASDDAALDLSFERQAEAIAPRIEALLNRNG